MDNEEKSTKKLYTILIAVAVAMIILMGCLGMCAIGLFATGVLATM